MDAIRELEIFTSVVERGSFASAARSLNLSPPTVTRAVADLEARIGVRLLDRSSRRCHTSEAGRRFAEDAHQVLAAYRDAIGVAAGDAVVARGLVKVTAPLVFGREYVAPALGRLLDSHQELSVELELSDRQLDLHEERIDIAVRIGAIADQSLIGRRVGSVHRVIVASPNYLQRRRAPSVPADLAEHTVVHHGLLADMPWIFRAPDGARIEQPVRARLAINQADAAIAAALAGRGLVSVLSYQVFDDLQSGRLVALLQGWTQDAIPVNIVWPEHRQRLKRVRVAIDYLAAVLSAVPALAAG